MTIDRAPTIREMAEEFQQTLGIGSNYLVMFGQAVAAREHERCAQIAADLAAFYEIHTFTAAQVGAAAACRKIEAAIQSVAGREA